LIQASKDRVYRLTARNDTTLMDLAYHWYPNNGRYPELESFSGCPGAWLSPPIRLFPNHIGLRSRPDASLYEVLIREPKHADAWTLLDAIYQEWQRPQEAEGALLRALSAHSDHPLAWNSLGIALEDQGKISAAEESHQKGVETPSQANLGSEKFGGAPLGI